MPKTELLQEGILFGTQFPSLGIFISKQDSIELNPKLLANAPSKTLDISNAPKMS